MVGVGVGPVFSLLLGDSISISAVFLLVGEVATGSSGVGGCRVQLLSLYFASFQSSVKTFSPTSITILGIQLPFHSPFDFINMSDLFNCISTDSPICLEKAVLYLLTMVI